MRWFTSVHSTIVARDGVTKVLLQADNSGPHTASSATGKDFTAAAMGRDTVGLAEFIATKPANDGLRDMDSRMVIQGRGLRVKFNKSLVGGIGGAPTGDVDAAGLKGIGAATG